MGFHHGLFTNDLCRWSLYPGGTFYKKNTIFVSSTHTKNEIQGQMQYKEFSRGLKFIKDAELQVSKETAKKPQIGPEWRYRFHMNVFIIYINKYIHSTKSIWICNIWKILGSVCLQKFHPSSSGSHPNLSKVLILLKSTKLLHKIYWVNVSD